jgi:hypothetical protein
LQPEPKGRYCNSCNTAKPLNQFYPSYRTQCKVCLKTKALPKRDERLKYLAAWRAANPDAAKVWYANNRPRKRAYNTRLYAENRTVERRRYDAWRKENPGKVNALIAKRNAAKRRQTPAWANQDAMQAVYIKAAAISRESGVRHDVDHVIPLQGKAVCGLHCEANLQILTKVENVRKWNRLLTEDGARC